MKADQIIKKIVPKMASSIYIPQLNWTIILEFMLMIFQKQMSGENECCNFCESLLVIILC